MSLGPVDGPGGGPPGSLKESSPAADTRLLEAATRFEAVFIQQMLSAMRATVPEGGALDGGHAEDVFSSLLDGQLSELAAGRIGKGLADAIYRQLTRGEGQ